MNLRRRVAVNSKSKYGAGKVELGPSINALLAPVFQMLNYEKGMQAEMLGAAMGSVGDMHGRLKRFRKRVEERRPQQLYFVKLDVQACFDTIPQARLLRLVEDLVSEDEYRVTKYVEVAPPAQQTTAAVHAGTGRPGGLDTQARPARKFVARAAALMDFKSSYEHVMDQQSTQRQGATTTTTRNRSTLAIMKRNTVVADTGYQKRHETDDLLALLEHHVRNHLVKIGKKYFRQKNGIPQGSVVSSILCNFFYGAHEREHLRFLHDGGDGDALLLRLVDDYLLITTDKDIATRFLQVMLDGNSEYGISVTLGKTLVNFDVQINGCKIPRLIAGQEREQFPYCGNLIDTTTLAISKDRTRNKQTNDDNGNDNDLHICDTLTVEVKRTPWQALYRKALTMLRLQLHAMFCDTRHNSRSVVWGNIYDAFVDAAVRLYAYSRSLHHRQRATQYQHRRAARNSPTDDVFTRTIAALIDDGVRLVRSRGREQAAGLKEAEDEGEGKGNRHQVTSVQIRWLAVQAFRGVLGRKQSRVGGTVRWLEALGRVSRSLGDGEAAGLWAVVRARARGEMGYRF